MIIVRSILTLFAIASATLGAGWAYQRVAEMNDDRRYRPPGELFSVNGNLMHMHCRGSASPTVIVEQGIGGQSLAWDEINNQMARITRTCSYDRAGMGYSEPVDKPTLSVDVAANLHQLLQAAGIDDDLVFVGWSAGGMYAREYQFRFPDRVKGMVLIDSAHEQQSVRMPPPDNQPNIDRLRRNHYLTQVGWMRLSRQIERQFARSPLSLEEQQRLTAIFQKSHMYETLVNEGVGLEQDLARGQAPRPVGDIALLVLVEGKPNNSFMQENLSVWHELQQELTELSSNSRLLVARKSAHAIHRTEPELVLAAVEEVVTAVRTGGRISSASSVAPLDVEPREESDSGG